MSARSRRFPWWGDRMKPLMTRRRVEKFEDFTDMRMFARPPLYDFIVEGYVDGAPHAMVESDGSTVWTRKVRTPG